MIHPARVTAAPLRIKFRRIEPTWCGNACPSSPPGAVGDHPPAKPPREAAADVAWITRLAPKGAGSDRAAQALKRAA